MKYNFIKNLKINAKLTLVAALFVCGFIIFGGYSLFSMYEIKVNGPIYRQIILQKDLLADILPPPEYVIESYLTTAQLYLETDNAKISRLIKKGDELRKNFEDRHAYWKNALPEGTGKDLLVKDAYDTAEEFFNARDKEFIPAILQRDTKRSEHLFHEVMEPIYEKHRLIIDKIVESANVESKNIETQANKTVNKSNALLLAVAGVIVLIVFIITRYITKIITDPLSRLVSAIDVMRTGDFTQRLNQERRDEFGTMAAGFNLMADALAGLIGQVQQSGVQVNSSATEMAAALKEQQATSNEVASTTVEIGATAKEISATAKELGRTVGEVSGVAESTAQLAVGGQTGLTRLEATMRQIMEATTNISAKLAILNEKTANINSVVTTINKVADQTNLLSLNAAIEAEKAGEYGQGFGVVATEIRRLADQTAVATYDIEQMVKEMQSAVAAGVMGMDKFNEEVRRGGEETRQVTAQLAEIIQQVQTLTPRFESVNEGMQAQSTAAGQISDALVQLGETAQQSAQAVRQNTEAVEQLATASHGLREAVSLFKVK
jgi:methyl-accepting chemotaxis protein WspA